MEAQESGSRSVRFPNPYSFHYTWLISNSSIKQGAKVDELKISSNPYGCKSERCHWDIRLVPMHIRKTSFCSLVISDILMEALVDGY